MKTLGFNELMEKELMEIDGGDTLTFTIVSAGVTAAVVGWVAIESAGEKIGKAAYKVTH